MKAGVHAVSSHITPKSGDAFIGEYGAILDGTTWTTADPSEAAFRAHNQDIDDVTIRNLVIRHMPRKGIHALHWASDRWTIENNELTACRTGVAAPNRSIVRNNYIHHNTGGGYDAYRPVNLIVEHNEIAYNGREQKIVGATDVTFRDNFVHHNAGDGIWYDAENTGAVIEQNRVEDNGRDGISYEISGRGLIRKNTVRRSAASGIFIATSKNVEVAENVLEDNFRGIQYFLNCGAVGGGDPIRSRRQQRSGQHRYRGQPKRRIRNRLWLHSQLHGDTGRAVSERVEATGLPQHELQSAVTRREVLVLGLEWHDVAEELVRRTEQPEVLE